MNALVELIKKIGIFMIAAQAVIHFAPDMKYARYMKLIVGVMVLLQFLAPVYGIVSGMETDWDERLSDIEKELSVYGGTVEFEGSYSAAETVTNNMEEEIKSKLNSALEADFSEKNYTVTSVDIELVKDEESDEGTVGYRIDKVRVIVWERTEDISSIDSTDKIKIDKIEKITSGISDDDRANDDTSEDGNISGNGSNADGCGSNGQEEEGSEDEITDSLRRKFCGVLGMEERYMEVIVYGAH